ncbi:MAG TPA: hypothetical protein VEC35_07835 [Noviherbaspirillum sp.]|nr:hypothetical protein [Noviherbaspirillum sp.]
MMTDKVFFEDKNGTRSGPYKTKFGADRITVFQDELHVTEGDRVIHPLPDETEQTYVAETVTHNAARRNIPAHYSITIAKEAAPPMPDTSATATSPDAHASGARAGNSDIENIAAFIQSLAESIDNTHFPAEQKDEARRLLRTLVEHPVVVFLVMGKGP